MLFRHPVCCLACNAWSVITPSSHFEFISFLYPLFPSFMIVAVECYSGFNADP